MRSILKIQKKFKIINFKTEFLGPKLFQMKRSSTINLYIPLRTTTFFRFTTGKRKFFDGAITVGEIENTVTKI